MNFVDAHVHFWDQNLMPYEWLHEVPSIAHRHTPETLREEAGADLPEKIVFVECGAPWLEEVKWIEQLAVREPRLCGLVAKGRANDGAKTSAAIAELKKHPLARGMRHPFEHEKDPDYCARPEFIAGVRELADAGLSFDICCKHHQLPAVIKLVRQCPQTSFILDHSGKPGIRAGLLDPWREHIRELSKLPNIVCKFSGLVTEADHHHWTPAQLKPYISHIFACFGPGRLLFGGDWPVAKLAAGYTRWLQTAREFTAQLSETDRRAVFHDNAERIYRI